MAAVSNQMSSYAEGLQGKAKTRYLEKLQFYWPTVDQEGMIRHLLTNVYHQLRLLILSPTWSCVTAKQFKAHKHTINLLVAVSAWTINRKSVVIGRVS